MENSKELLIQSLNNLTVTLLLSQIKTCKKEGEKTTGHPYPLEPRRPERPEQGRWPSPTPLPRFNTEDTGRLLKQILDRLDAVEKRLERIEKLLTAQTP
jgi:hypothetical protein